MAYGEAVENLSREMVLVSHIQRGAVQDGPGWRTTVYLKGCPLRCPWCYNAESLHFQQELRYVPQFCIGAAACGRCLEVCRSGGIVPPGPDTDGRPVVRRPAAGVWRYAGPEGSSRRDRIRTAGPWCGGSFAVSAESARRSVPRGRSRW